MLANLVKTVVIKAVQSKTARDLAVKAAKNQTVRNAALKTATKVVETMMKKK